ncbi:MAG: hypothetical protein EB141_12485 [Verrucomicrobia bacterium]|nr:hypothetical protein [Verrucomicrobiota bacterium]NBU10026.1 hypothetical protein [Pseudomonadota bacterium]NDA67488.1 hypothetical protein [Verrucomicrobiota bacterium]NDB76439.1 hypothetical protein [Verrucomicrobiota bacterium]NDE99288.1 hypothetical protein [Verrucomicrobiota bacterium]
MASVPPETKVQAVLIWGTDESKPTGKSLKEVDTKLREKLGKIFKWQNYFEVSRQNSGALPGKSQVIKLSEDCSVDIKILPDNTAEVKLMGKGKAIVTRRHSLTKPDALVLAGDDKNNTAWFVVLNFN